MSLRENWRSIAVLGLLALLAGPSDALAVPTLLDDFNRPNDTNMGPNWNERAGDFQISGMMASGFTSGSLMTYVGASSSSVTVDVYSFGNSLDYGAVVLGYADNNNHLFIKVQSQNGAPDFDSYGFYFGNNGSNNGAWSESDFAFFASPFASARMTVSLAGNVVMMSLDTDFDGIPDQVYSRGSVPLGLLGTEIGLGGFDSDTIRADNFSAEIGEPIPEPGTLLLLGSGLTGLALRRRRRAL